MAAGGLSRRNFIGAAGAGAALLACRPLRAVAGRRRQTVAIFGGGVAGLTAAHELVDRGFDVAVYERRAWGGKARSMGAPGTGAGGRRDLPGEHGFRVLFGFERNLQDTLQRIPFGSNHRGAYDNLVSAGQARGSRLGQRDWFLPWGSKDPRPYTPARLRETLIGVLLERDLPPESVVHFADRLIVFFSSCDARRNGQWDNVDWSGFVRAERYGGDFRKIFSELPAHVIQASKADRTSTNFVGTGFEWWVYNVLGLNSEGDDFIKIFDRPTSEAWIDPWTKLLTRLGVDLRLGYALEGLDMAGGRIASATVQGPTGRQSIVADHYIVALPVERARTFWSPEILSAAPGLDGMNHLETDWMSGIQFFLRKQTPLSAGHVWYTDSPWCIGSISQAQFWQPDFAKTYGDGGAHDCLSVVISDWNTAGRLTGKRARDCTADEVAAEVWNEMKLHLNDQQVELTDELSLGWHLDPGLLGRAGGGFDFEDPLVLPSVGAWQHRPESGTDIDNLILAGDYVRGEWQVANMEIANESGRRAANVVLERSGSRETPARAFGIYRPPEFEALKKIDKARWQAGKPHLLEDAEVPAGLLGG